MRPFTSTLPFTDALALALEATRRITRTEHVTLTEADGRVVAHDVISPLDVPGYDRAAMDGYAVSGDGTAFRQIGRVFTGEVFDGVLARAFGPEVDDLRRAQIMRTVAAVWFSGLMGWTYGWKTLEQAAIELDESAQLLLG